MKIIDTFIFNDELELLDIRLELLYNIIDLFIIVEGNETFKGNIKPLFYTENKHKFNDYNDKIVVIENISTEYNNIVKTDGMFNREDYSRNIIKKQLQNLNLDENDIILHSDIDEIPNPKFLTLLRNNTYNFRFLSIKQQLYYYNFETIDRKTVWYGTFVIYYKYLENNISHYRNIRYQYPWNINIKLDEPNVYGWHFSYFGDFNMIQNKLLSFSEKTTLSNNVINKKDNLYKYIKSRKLWFSNKSLDYVNFDTNNNLIKTKKIINFHNKLKQLN